MHLDGVRTHRKKQCSGEGGIRTHGGPEDHNGFRDRPFQPLRHLSEPDELYQQCFKTSALQPGKTRFSSLSYTWRRSGYEIGARTLPASFAESVS